MQQGIAQLPGAAQSMGPQGQMAPGQSAPAQVMPSQQPMTPQAYKGMLESLPPQELFAMWANPMDKTPKWAVMTAYAKAVEQARLMEQAQGQQAMAQSQSMQGTPSIAEQVMSQPMPGMGPVMAAQGDMMQGYAGGGAVAFAPGGAVTQEESDRQKILAALSGAGMSVAKLAAAGIDVATIPVRTLASIYNTVARAPRAFDVPVPTLPKDVTLENLTPAMDVIRRMEAGPPPTPPTELPASEVASEIERLKSRPTGIATAIPPAPPPGTGRPAAAAPAPTQQPPAQASSQIPISADVPSDVQAAYDRRIATLQGRQRPEGLLALERQMAEQAKANIEAQRAEREQFGRESRQGLEDVLARTRGAPSGMELLRVAAGIDTRKRGAGLGSLFGGVSDVMAQRQAAEEAARREYRTAQATERQMAGAIRQLEALELQRQYLQERGRFDEANKVQDQIDVLKGEMARYAVERKDKAIEQERQRALVNIEGQKVGAAAEANRLSRLQADQSRLLSLTGLEQNRLLASRQAIEKEHRENPRYKMIYTQAGALGFDKLTPEQQRQYQLAEADLQRKLREVEATISPTLNRLYQDLGLSRGAPTNVQRYDSSGNRITGG